MSRDEILAEAERILREADVCEIRLWFSPLYGARHGVTVKFRDTGDERDGAGLAHALGGSHEP